ncbi:response regulator transcription factor [Bacteroidota bacterium]
MKVVIIEDSPEIAKAISLTFRLRWADACISTVAEGAKGIELVGTEDPDIVILDINLPDISGFEVLSEIRRFSKVPIVILTAREGSFDELIGLESGADEYIIKPFSASTLIARVRAILRRAGKQYTTEPYISMCQAGDITIDFLKREVVCSNGRQKLTPTECKIISTLGRYQGTVVQRDILKQHVWGDRGIHVGKGVLKRYVYQLRKKLGDDDHQECVIRTVRSEGYMLVQ